LDGSTHRRAAALKNLKNSLPKADIDRWIVIGHSRNMEHLTIRSAQAARRFAPGISHQAFRIK
jgi:hypothetical protein